MVDVCWITVSVLIVYHFMHSKEGVSSKNFARHFDHISVTYMMFILQVSFLLSLCKSRLETYLYILRDCCWPLLFWQSLRINCFNVMDLLLTLSWHFYWVFRAYLFFFLRSFCFRFTTGAIFSLCFVKDVMWRISGIHKWGN